MVRKVGTFDADGAAGRGADELRQNDMPAQGVDGFNVPSLFGMATGAPYLHNGAALTLEELLSSTFQVHFTAGNQVFAPTVARMPAHHGKTAGWAAAATGGHRGDARQNNSIRNLVPG